MLKLNCVIVDDEPLAIDVLTRLVNSIPEYNLEASFQHPLEALTYINNSSSVNVVFLDINMPQLSGLDLPEHLNDPNIAVVFVTAYDQHALKSYEINAVDYLMKPVSLERILKTTGKIKERLESKSSERASAEESFIFVKTDQQTVKVNLEDVLYFEGLKDYVNIKMKDHSRIVSRESLKFIESKLASQNFVRIHRSYVISFKHIEAIESGTVKIGEHLIPIGKSYKDVINKLIKGNVIGDRNK